MVLDEPTNGLDPNQIIEVRKLIKEIAKDRAVILSTHILSEVQATCDDIVMIEHGQIVFKDTLHAFNNYIEPSSLIMEFELLPNLEQIRDEHGVIDVEVVHHNKVKVEFQPETQITKKLIHASVQNGWSLLEIYLEKTSLDSVLLNYLIKQKEIRNLQII